MTENGVIAIYQTCLSACPHSAAKETLLAVSFFLTWCWIYTKFAKEIFQLMQNLKFRANVEFVFFAEITQLL